MAQKETIDFTKTSWIFFINTRLLLFWKSTKKKPWGAQHDAAEKFVQTVAAAKHFPLPNFIPKISAGSQKNEKVRYTTKDSSLLHSFSLLYKY